MLQRGPITQTNTTVFTGSGNVSVVNEAVYVVNKSSGAATTVTLPPAASVSVGRVIVIKDGKGDAGSNNITVEGYASDTIDGALNYVIGSNYGSAKFQWNGSQWNVMATYGSTSSGAATALTAATTLTRADAGRVFTVSQAAAYDIDLPSPTTGAGLRFLFQLVGPAANAVTITVLGAAATFEGTIVNDVTSVIPATGSTLTFASGAAALGDNIEVVSTSTSKYLVRAVSSAAGGITIA